MRNLSVIVCSVAIMIASCKKENDNPPPDPGGKDTTTVDTTGTTGDTNIRFFCKINGVDYIPDSAGAFYNKINGKEALSLSTSKIVGGIDTGFLIMVGYPIYTGKGTYTLHIDPDSLPSTGTASLGYSIKEGFNQDIYINTICGIAGVKKPSGTLTITKDHTDGVISGTFSSHLCLNDSTTVEITEGVFNNVYLVK